MKKNLLVLAAATACSVSAYAQQSSVTVYGRLDLSFAQQADAVENYEIRPGSGNRLGFRGVEDLGNGLKAVFQFEHRFTPENGAANSIFWAGRSVVGLENSLGRLTLGRDENPAYVLAQLPGDPWGTDTVAANDTIIKGRIGQQRYANSIFYMGTFGGFTAGANYAEASASNQSTGGALDSSPYSLGLGYKNGGLQLGVGYENPPDNDDYWSSAVASYNFGIVKLGGFFGTGKTNAAMRRESFVVSATAPLIGGEARLSVGQLKNKSGANPVLDKQIGLGYHYPLSKRTTVYADVVNESRDNMPADRKETGFDLGLKHNF